MVESLKELATAVSHEKDSGKLRLLLDKLIQALGDEQKQVHDEIKSRINRHVREMEKQGLDPSIP